MTIRVLIIFGSTYGYTERYANWIAEDLRALPQAPEVDTLRATEVTPELVEAADSVIIGGSDYGGFLTGAPSLKKKIVPFILPKKGTYCILHGFLHRRVLQETARQGCR